MSLAQEIKAKKRNALILGVLAAGGLYGGLMRLGFDIGMWASVAFFFVYFVLTRPKRFVLWLRRFNLANPKRTRFNRILNIACDGLCVPVTIQDSSFDTSYAASWSRLFQLLPLAFGVITILPFIVGFGLAWIAEQLSANSTVMIVVGIAGGLGSFCLLLYKYKGSLHRRGQIILRKGSATAHLREVLAKIASRKSIKFGVVVMNCSDEEWQEVVQLAMCEASAVIIDVSDLTANLHWELIQTLRLRDPGSILLACGTTEGRRELSTAVRDQLQAIVGEEKLSRLNVFYYPSEASWLRGILYNRLARELFQELSSCIEYSSHQVENSLDA